MLDKKACWEFFVLRSLAKSLITPYQIDSKLYTNQLPNGLRSWTGTEYFDQHVIIGNLQAEISPTSDPPELKQTDVRDVLRGLLDLGQIADYVQVLTKSFRCIP